MKCLGKNAENGGKNVRKTYCGSVELAFLASANKEGRTSRRKRPQMQLAVNNRKRLLNFDFYYCFFLKEQHSSSSSSFLSSVSSRLIYFVIFFSKTCLAVQSQRFQIRNTAAVVVYIHIKQAYLVLSKQEKNISFRSFRHFVPKDQNKLYTHDKNRPCRTLGKNNLFIVFVMYILGSVHEKSAPFESESLHSRTDRT